MARTRIRPAAGAAAPPTEQVSSEVTAADDQAQQGAAAGPETPAPPAQRRKLSSGAPTQPSAPQTAAAALAAKPSAEDAAKALAAALDDSPEPPRLPFSSYPHPSEQLAALIDTTIDQAEGLDLVKEFEELAAELEIKDALTPQVVRAHINRVENNASRAHRLFILTKAQLETYRIHAETALGAMRDVARAKLEQLKARKEMTKQVTEQDVADMAAVTYPDEWSNINDRLKRGKLTLERLERFADLWQRRSFSLSELNS